jgi:stage V sporulation protein D (sporulation-specific penicillin-binding protein)
MPHGNIQKARIHYIIAAVVFVGAIVVLRLFQLQVIHGSSYAEKGESQYVRSSSVFDRGTIYFTDKDGGTVAAATIEDGYRLGIVPSQLVDPDNTYTELQKLLAIDRSDFAASAQKRGDPYEELSPRVNSDVGDSITALGMRGVVLAPEKWRFYPGGSLASKAIGFVSYQNGGSTLVGSYGLERYYNDVLTRTNENLSINFFAELFANVQPTLFKSTAAQGDVVTSIETTVQSELETAVASIGEKWGSEAVGAVVMDPKNGEIVAMAQVPTFDLNDYRSADDISIYTNPFAQNVYEMGSIIKPLIMAAAVDVGAVTPQTTYTDKGSIVVSDRTIYNFDKKARGLATMQDVLNQSLNTGMVFIEQKMGKEAMHEYLVDRYRFDQRTGIDLPGEVKGLLGNLKAKNDVNYANAAFGQGIALTPISIVRGFAALANGGVLVTPHLATSIVHNDGEIETLEYEESKPILKPETVSTITNMLVHVVDDGYDRGLEHYSVAAKTGTAQIARPGGLGYYDDRNLHSLIGYFPASNPRYVIFFYNYYPKGGYGGQFAIQTLADPFFHMVQFLGNYYGITPDR